ncbi:hypothetical protein [Peribacillus sp. SCS-37]|uniref:hypothetical protein n=1 Tax=Paraperibacillus esterisolvens TaxID=3115296 RepID=UPI003906CDDB
MEKIRRKGMFTMYVKLYQYHIKPNKKEEYLREADETKWIEIMRYDNREECSRITETSIGIQKYRSCSRSLRQCFPKEKKKSPRTTITWLI